MEKRLLLAIVLSIIIITFWYMLTPKRQTAPVRTQQEAIPEEKQERKVIEHETVDVPANVSTKDYVIETDSVKVVFNNLGARIKHWYVKEGDAPSKWPDLAFYNNGKYLVTYPNLAFGVTRHSENSVTFYGQTGNLRIYKTYQISKDNLHTLRFTITNSSSQNEPFELHWGPGLGSDSKKMKEEKRLSRVVAIKELDKKYALTKIKGQGINPKEYIWAGVDNRYFAAIVSCKQFDSIYVNKGTEKGLFELTFSAENSIKANSKTQFDFNFYLGPKCYDKLKKLNFGLEETINFGIFKPLSKIAFASLKFFYKITHNYGIAIIILTIILQVILYPLSIKSFQASKSMKQLQPKIKELQQKYKNDPKRLNVETMNMYKAHKVNPLGGCLPMLGQLPIFWALFTTLRNTYELRGAPFAFWIRDLSTADPYRILPILMGISMFVQQKLSGTTADPSQKTFAYIMPIVFTFLFMNFPAGLVLYWLTNSILTLITQNLILARKK